MILLSTLLVVLSARPSAQDSNLDAWFKKDNKGQSCASCHSVDGIELRGFSQSDLVRRTKRHHQGEVAETIRQLVAKHQPRPGEIGPDIRPMQPDYEVLHGKSPAERDNLFLLSLKERFPKLFLPIQNLDDALRFQRVILDIELMNLPVGIKMNRLSADGVHGEEYQTIANWFPDIATFDSDKLRPELEEYYKSPTEENLGRIDHRLLSIYRPTDGFSELALAKYRSLMVYQHELRTKKVSKFLPKDNPFWQVADFARLYAESDPILVRVPEEVANAKKMPTTFKDQLKELRLPWFWLGWMRDPSLTKSSMSKETVRAEYFCRFLEEDGPYIAHEAFMLTRKLAEQNRNPLYKGIPFEIQYSFFLTNTPLIEREPKDTKAKSLFRLLTANSFKMSLYLLEADLKKNKKAVRKVPQANQMKFIRQYFSDIKKAEDTFIDRIQRVLMSASGV
jgi:hypothetical protein